MSKYPDLVQRLRGKKLNCICAAKSVSECCCNTDWPESSCNEAADAIEHLMGEIDFLDEHWRKNKKRIAELEAALKPFAEKDCPEGLLIVVNTDDLRQARKVLENA
jgi:hypothetical protein